MLRQIGARKFAEWRAYADLEPFDQEREDLRAASIAKTIADVNRGKGKPSYKIKDFTLKRDMDVDDGKTPVPEQKWKFWKSFAQAYAMTANEVKK